MIRFLCRRLLVLSPLLLGVSVFVFAVLRHGKTDPAMAYLRLSGLPPTESLLATTRESLGLNQPLWKQYLDWLSSALQGDLGLSYVTGNPALNEILYYLPATIELTMWAMAATIFISVPLGIAAALYKDRWPDHLTRIFAFSAVSMPSFWLGFLLVLLFSRHLDILPAMGRGGPEFLILPVFTLSFMSMGINIRLVRASMLEHMHSRSVIYARSRGLKKWRIIGQHVLRNAFIPVLTSMSMHFGELLGGAVIVENIFNWPGVGRYVVSAIYNHDYPVIQTFTLVTTLIFVFVNLLTDVLYARIDPRIRLGEGR
ncbi:MULTISPECIES: nickel ABC transporter permease subunit NikB [Desulfovibrio]|uniref:Nickel transport system permease protein n=3 Tax=Desulfovibrio TaxID=872 RepID=A0AA94L3D0_DESDE|nr:MULTISPECIES: nickel ABC transporter permease subunit NikB [Desulfovibrio]ATD81046.1 nickel ABC transporter permease subunit NikB [Desulfovibrio sp. G11]SFW70906.1 nickel transport system permease protein [Desulfovibrio desulfuricans]SPD36636.1 ABC transporter, transmembrane domain [Desulfovibrio sp. G11]